MRQSTVIFGGLLAAFVIYITVRGQLPGYLNLFSSNSGIASSTSTPKTEASVTQSTGIKPQLPPEIARRVDEAFRNMGLG